LEITEVASIQDGIVCVYGRKLRLDGTPSRQGAALFAVLDIAKLDVAAGVDMDALHAEALTEDRRRRVVKVRQGCPEAVDSDGMVLALLPLVIEQAHAEAVELVTSGGASNAEIAQVFANLEREQAERLQGLTS
jgi:hypothetical protein